MDESETNKNWLQLELDVARLFSAAPLPPDRSRGNGSEVELYVGRRSEVRRMIEAVRDPAKHILLYGERGLGKTSISNNFWVNYGTNNQIILVARVQAYPLDNFSSLWLRALEEFGAISRKYQEIRTDFERVSPDIVSREFKNLNRTLVPIIIIDEFDQLQKTEARELTANLLKSLHDGGVNVTIILIGVADNVEDLIANHQSLRRVLSLVKLERMSAIDLNEILDRRLGLTPLSFVEDARSAVVGVSCGVPYYVQTLGKFAVLNAIQEQRVRVCMEDVNAAIEKFIVDSGESFTEGYQRATESRQVGNIFQEVILASALARSDASGFFKPSEVCNALNLVGPGKIQSYPRVQQYLSQFASDRRGNILIRRGREADYRYRFSDATMQPFVIMKAIKDRQIDDMDLQSLLFYWNKQEFRDGGHRLGLPETSVAQPGASGLEDSCPRQTSTDPADPPNEMIITPTTKQTADEESPVPLAPGAGLPIEANIIPTATEGVGGDSREPTGREPTAEPLLKTVLHRLLG